MARAPDWQYADGSAGTTRGGVRVDVAGTGAAVGAGVWAWTAPAHSSAESKATVLIMVFPRASLPQVADARKPPSGLAAFS